MDDVTKVLKENINKYPFVEAFLKIDKLLLRKDIVNVAIDGMSASFKTSFSKVLMEIYHCNVFHMDDFFLNEEMKTQERLGEIGGNIHYERFKDEVLNHLGEEFKFLKYDCKTGDFIESELIKKNKLNVIEGVYSLHPYFGDIYDLSIFFKVDDDIQKQRLLMRNEKLYEKFINQWIPMENRYFKENNLMGKSDLVIDTSNL